MRRVSKVLVWRADEIVGNATTRKREIINIVEDGNEPTLIGKPRGPETPICKYCGKDARHATTLVPFYRNSNGIINAGWKCA